MAEIDQHLVASKMTSTIKLTGVLISSVHEHLWGLDDTDAGPSPLPNLLAALQAVGKSLSALRKFATDDVDLVASVLHRLTEPVDECAAEMDGLRGKIADGELQDMVEKGLVFQYIAQLQKHQKVFALALQVMQDHWKLSKAFRGYIQDSEGGEVELDDPVLGSDKVLEKRKKHLNWLYSKDYDSGLQGILERSVPGVGEWILQSPIVQNWLKAHPGFLNLCGSGFGGAGKTHISAKIIQHIQTTPHLSKHAVAFFFFPHLQPGDKHPTEVLRCLTLQLACQARAFVSVSRILHDQLISEQAPPTVDKLSRALIDTTKLFDRVFLVLHGLDEYEHGADLVPFFRALATANISVFATTGPAGLAEQYSFLAPAKIDLAARAEDINTYIRFRIEECPNAKHLLGRRADLDKFVAELTKCANGMFLYAHLVIGSFLQQPTVAHIFSKLNKLQATLLEKDRYTTIYTLAIARVRALPPPHAALAFKILLWAVKAAYPLPLSALREAIAITDDAPGELDSSDTPTMLAVCEGLITIDARSGAVRLVHASARDFLARILPADADYRVAHAYTTYLSHGLFATPASRTRAAGHRSVEERLHTFPFYAYATKHLVQHLAACEAASTTEMLLAFVRREGAIESYFQAHGQSFRERGRASFPLRMAIHIGHLPVVLQLLADGVDPFAHDENGHAAFRWAVTANHGEIVQMLLLRWREFIRSDYEREEAEIWYSDMYGRSVLHIAARLGFVDLVKLILAHEDREDRFDGRPMPLHEAVLGGHESVVQLILKAGVDPMAVDDNRRTALHVAAAGGNLAIVVQLVSCRNFRCIDPTGRGKRNQRFDVNAKNRMDATPLHLAALGAHADVVQYLVHQGANCSIQDRAGETALFQAVRSGDARSVRIILQRDARIPINNHRSVTVIHLAATGGDTDIIALLLDYGADMFSLVGGRSALELALAGGHEAAVQLLRSRGAEAPLPENVDAMLVPAAKAGDTGLVQLLLSHGGNPSGKPLIAAAEAGRWNIVNLLLDGGADMALQDELGWTALYHAANGGHVRIVRLLAGQSAVRNLQDWTAMVLAAENGHEAVVRVLLPDVHDGVAMTEDMHPAFFLAARNGHHGVASLLAIRGANVQTKGNDGRSAFIIAVEDGHSKVVELLLRFGADISETTTSGESALFVAARCGSVDIVRMLLENGADICETDTDGQTALFVAGKHGHREVYALLVEKGVNQFVRDRSGKMACIDGDGGADDGDNLPRVVGRWMEGRYWVGGEVV